MCLNPITIPNQSKYISLKHKDSFLMQVPCGYCSECQNTIGNQWYYRAYYEFNDVLRAGGYVLFDTLTYAPKYLPMLSDTWSMLDKNDDFPCFSYLHIRYFIENLRIRLKRAGFSQQSFRWFLSSEYGTSEHHTHRPHYHILFYVLDNRLDPIFLSRLIADIWHYGRTDGVPYKSRGYVTSHNLIRPSADPAARLRTCRYVTKYVQKSCQFDYEIRKRVAIVMNKLAEFADPVTPEKWLDTEYARRERLKLLRMVNQFHRQSQHFGESALGDIDLNQLYRDGCLYMPDTKGLIIPVPMPMYYKRKMFYDLVEFNGSRYWVLNEDGKIYKKVRFGDIRQRLIDRYASLMRTYNLGYDASQLADYVLTERGRIKGFLPESTLDERIDDIDLINYSTCSDKMQFGYRGLTPYWLGDSQQGYIADKIPHCLRLSLFVEKYVYFDPDLELQLEQLFNCMQNFNVGKQKLYETKQRLKNLYKHYFPLVI